MQFVEIRIKEIIQDSKGSNSYKMIFEDVGGAFILPIMISSYDAQPIMAMLDGESTRRPRTHELFCNFIDAAGYHLRGMYIVDFQRGIFHTTAIFANGERTIELDCRPSDAVCITLQCGTKMFVDNSIVEKVSIMASVTDKADSVESRIGVLQKRLDRLVREERYEDAVRVRDMIDQLKKGN